MVWKPPNHQPEIEFRPFKLHTSKKTSRVTSHRPRRHGRGRKKWTAPTETDVARGGFWRCGHRSPSWGCLGLKTPYQFSSVWICLDHFLDVLSTVQMCSCYDRLPCLKLPLWHRAGFQRSRRKKDAGAGRCRGMGEPMWWCSIWSIDDMFNQFVCHVMFNQ